MPTPWKATVYPCAAACRCAHARNSLRVHSNLWSRSRIGRPSAPSGLRGSASHRGAQKRMTRLYSTLGVVTTASRGLRHSRTTISAVTAHVRGVRHPTDLQPCADAPAFTRVIRVITACTGVVMRRETPSRIESARCIWPWRSGRVAYRSACSRPRANASGSCTCSTTSHATAASQPRHSPHPSASTSGACVTLPCTARTARVTPGALPRR